MIWRISHAPGANRSWASRIAWEHCLMPVVPAAAAAPRFRRSNVTKTTPACHRVAKRAPRKLYNP
jgi:hypothetical protein